MPTLQQKFFILRLFVIGMVLCAWSAVEANSPMWTFTPLTPTTLSVASSSTATVQYTVTNQSPVPHTLMMRPIAGITQVSTAGNCSNPFTLSPSNPSCTLTLLITGSALNSNTVGGPQVCEQGSNGNPSPLQCYQPSQNDILNVTRSTVVQNPHAYISNAELNTVSKCTVDAITGALSGCDTTGDGFALPLGLAINNGYVYITSYNNTVSKCTVDATTGALSGCDTTGSGFSTPTSLAINNSYAYIPNTSGSSVSQCTVDATTGELSNCDTTGSGYSAPFGIAINNGYAYISNTNSNVVLLCIVDPITGELSSCESTASGFSAPTGVVINNGYAYITNTNSDIVSLCVVNPITGALSDCESTGSGFSSPLTIALNGTYAYISNGNNETISKCDIHPTAGTLSGCESIGSGFSISYGIGFS